MEQLTSSQKNNRCDCAKKFQVRLGRQRDYEEFKKCLDRGNHPAFIGRGSYATNCMNGGALLFDVGYQLAAVALIQPHYGTLVALNVAKSHRGHGLGSAILEFLMPNFARVIEDRVPWFEARGYRRIGSLKSGISLKTQIMARDSLFSLAGRLKQLRS